MATFTYQVQEHEDGKMLREILQNRFRFSRRMLRRLRSRNLVTVNGEVIYFTARVKVGDFISITIEDTQTEEILPPQPIDFTVVYEDDDLIVIDKPPGLVVHPTRGYPDGTLANGLMHYWQQQGKSYRFHPVTRLDKDTSGLMVIAKHPYAHAFLAKQMEKKRYERIYLAIAEGKLTQDKGTISLPIGYHPENPFARAVVYGEGGAEAVTHYEVLERFPSASLVRLRLETGRTHQIRVHLSAIGHPLIGDPLYGKESPLLSRQALHAAYLCFFHPRTQNWLEWESPLPEDMRQVIARLKGEG